MKTPFGRLFASLTFLLAAPIAQAAPGNVDFSSYDLPLYEQVVNRIKAKVLARLGEERSTRDRYFIIPFATKTANHPNIRLFYYIRCWGYSNPNWTPASRRKYRTGILSLHLNWLRRFHDQSPSVRV